jgi:hypothetical protein
VKRETRLNLWFLIAFLILSLPGGIILFRKKLNPEARPIFMTDEVERRLPYMAPGQTPPGIVRVVPPRTSAFVADLSKRREGEVQPIFETGPQGQPLPLLSADRQLQAVSLRRLQQKVLLDLVDWSGRPIERSIRKVELIFDQQRDAMTGNIDSLSHIPLPESIVRELMNYGYIAPPKQIGWIEITIPQQADLSRLRQIIIVRNDGGRETITLPNLR